MNALGLLTKALMNHNPHHSLAEWRERLDWSLTTLKMGDESYLAALEAVLLYDRDNGKCPSNATNLKSWVALNTGNHAHLAKSSALIDSDLESLTESGVDVPDDCETSMRDVYRVALKEYDTRSYDVAKLIVSGKKGYPKGSGQVGIEAAELYMADRRKNRMDDRPKVVDGDIRENLDHIVRLLDEYLADIDMERVLTGFQHIDECTLIGRKYQNRWIGILGYTNHGKSMFLNSMLYNIARAGKNVLLVPREASVTETWMRFLFMHSVNFTMPFVSLSEWQMSKGQVAPEVYQTMRFLIEDLNSGTTFKGKLDVKQLRSWDEITEYLRLQKSRGVEYDVLALDYLTHLEVTGKNDVEEHKKDFRKAQMLSQNGIMNDNSGLVIITPLQANRTGHDDALAREGDDKGKYESLGAIDWYTQAAQDMDMVVGVWYEGDLKDMEPPEMKVFCMKSRAEKYFADHMVQIDRRTRYIRDKNQQMRGVSADAIVAEELDSNQIDEMLYGGNTPAGVIEDC